MKKITRLSLMATLVLGIAPAWAASANALIAKSHAAQEKGSTQDALVLIQSAIVAHPGDPANYIALADYYYRNDHPNAALKYYDDALFINPADKVALKGIALAQIAVGDSAGAQSSLDKLEQVCSSRCPEAMAIREAMEKSKKDGTDAASTSLDKH